MERKGPARSITLEILRAGPPHNQLLSPLTQYLAICGEAGASLFQVPWEHAPFERRLEDLRYEGPVGEDPARRVAETEAMGRDIAKLLGTIPALAGVLAGHGDEGAPEVTHLRLVLSASELGLIPFELSKTPSGLQMPAENWLMLQVHVPISLTRHVRSVPYESAAWPEQARVLFIASDPDELPFKKHRKILIDAVEPWLPPQWETIDHQSISAKTLGDARKDDLEVFGDEDTGNILTIVRNASIDDVKLLCRQTNYTHVHVLAHGGEDETTDYRSFGLGLNGEIVTGNRFASAITTTKNCGTTQPGIVTLATCDSANIGSVMQAGASFAHSLHQAGVPLVIASQFPLSFEGSEIALKRLYEPSDGLLWGSGHPVCTLHDVRQELAVEHEAQSHDWASLVVYEAFPPTLDVQLEKFHFKQAKSALKNSESHLENLFESAWSEEKGWIPEDAFAEKLALAEARCASAREALPIDGAFAIEAMGLKASNYKKCAEYIFKIATDYESDHEAVAGYMKASLKLLGRAYDAYSFALDAFLRLHGEAQQDASLHWLVVQTLSTGSVLGRPLDGDYWGVGRRSAKAYLQEGEIEDRAWSYGSLAELELLQLANRSVDEDEFNDINQRVVDNVTNLVELFSEASAQPIRSTRDQFDRYEEWWGSKVFQAHLKTEKIERHVDWSENGLHTAARQALDVIAAKEGSRRDGVDS